MKLISIFAFDALRMNSLALQLISTLSSVPRLSVLSFFPGERCLDPETYLLDLHHVNPNCEWILKPRTA